MTKMNNARFLTPDAVAKAGALSAQLLAAAVGQAPPPDAPLNQRISHMLDIITDGAVKKPGRDLLVQPFAFWQMLPWGNSTTQYEFLQSGQSTFSCNWPQAGQLPNTMGFAVQRVSVWADTGYTSAGAVNSAGYQAAATAFPIDIAEQLRLFHELALVQMSVGPRQVINDHAVFLPRGAGPADIVSLVNTNATTVNQIAMSNNGAPADIHRDTFPKMFPIGPGESVKFTVSLPSGLTLPNSAAGVVWVRLEGQKIEEAR